MILPSARQDQQRFLPLEDKPMHSLAQRRVYVGEFFEQATQALFGAERLNVSTAADICPDLVLHPAHYLENKSIGKSGELVVRKQQFDREMQFTETNLAYYVLWRHDAAVITSTSREDLYAMLARHAREVLVIPSSKIHELCKQRPLIKWTQLGQSPEKCQGYRIRWADLNACAAGEQDYVVWSRIVSGHAIGPITLRIVPMFTHAREDIFIRAVYRS